MYVGNGDGDGVGWDNFGGGGWEGIFLGRVGSFLGGWVDSIVITPRAVWRWGLLVSQI